MSDDEHEREIVWCLTHDQEAAECRHSPAFRYGSRGECRLIWGTVILDDGPGETWDEWRRRTG